MKTIIIDVRALNLKYKLGLFRMQRIVRFLNNEVEHGFATRIMKPHDTGSVYELNIENIKETTEKEIIEKLLNIIEGEEEGKINENPKS